MLFRKKSNNNNKSNIDVDVSLPKNSSPFISISPISRICLISILLGLIILIWFRDIFYPIPIPSSGWMSLALQVNLLILAIPFIFYKPDYGWFHPLIFYVFNTLIFHVRRSYIYIYGIPYHVAMADWDSERLTLLVTYDLGLRAVALLIYYFGFFCISKIRVPQINFERPRNFKLKALIIVSLSFIVWIVYMQMQGGLIAHLLTWGSDSGRTPPGSNYIATFILISLFTCQIWMAMEHNAPFQPLFWACLLFTTFMSFTANGSRGIIIFVVINCLIIWMLRQRKINFRNIIITLALLLSLLGLLGELRYQIILQGARGNQLDLNVLSSSNSSDSNDSNFTKGLMEMSERTWLYQSDLPILAHVPHRNDYLYGKSYLALLTLPIPRDFWPEDHPKPDPTFGSLEGEIFFNEDFSIPAEELGEAYWNFGIPGVLFVFFLFGMLHRWLAEVFYRYASEPSALALYGITIVVFKPITIGIFIWLLLLVPTIIILQIIGAISWKSHKNKNLVAR